MRRCRNGLWLVLLLTFGADAAQLQWKLVREQEGIRVYLADVPGSRYQAYRGVMNVRADMHRLLELQQDVAGSCAWIFTCAQQHLLQSDGAVSWLYTRFQTPWPVTPRDSILEITTQTSADGAVIRLLKGVPEHLPQERGFVRVSRVDGMWRLQPRDDGQVEVLYQAHTEPGGSVPSWLANSFVVDAPLQTLKAFRALAEAP